MKKRILLSVLLVLSAMTGLHAQGLLLRDVFREMPDSLMPYLTKNDRLDFIDFIDSGMKAEVKNLLGGVSVMESLADDSLSIRMNDHLRVDMLLIDTVVVVVETYLTDSIHGQSSVKTYTADWHPIRHPLPWSDAQKRRIEQHCLQNILKWDDEISNNR